MKLQVLFCLLFMLIIGQLNSQTYKVDYAKKLSSQFNYVEAYPVWEDLAKVFLKKQKGEWEYLREASKAAEKSEQYDKALYWIKVLVDKNKAVASDYPTYFSLICINKKQSTLEIAVKSAREKFPNDKTIEQWSNNISKISDINSKKSEYKVTNFRTNKRGEEFSAVPYKEGLVLVSNKRNTGFINRIYGRTNQHFLDLIYISNPLLKKNKDVLWNEIKRTKSHDGPIAFSSDFNLASITSNQNVVFKKDKIKYANLELTIYRLSQGKWNQTDLFKWNNSSYSCGHGFIDALGDLYFASNMPGGFGGSDLYKCKWNGSEFDAPVNLGITINTSKDEMFPFFSDDGVLYFSSNGWPSQGGIDIFSSDFLTFEPENLGSPINTNADDFSFFMDSKTNNGYISSNRDDWKDKVFLISKNTIDKKTVISVFGCDNSSLINVSIRITDLTSNLSVNRMTNALGVLNFIPRQNSSYSIFYAGDDKYAADSIIFSYKEETSNEIKIQVKPKNQIIRIKVVDEDSKVVTGVQLSTFKGGLSISKNLISNFNDGIILSANEFYTCDSIVASSINFIDNSLVINDLNQIECGDTIEHILTIKKQSNEKWINLGLILYDFDLYNLRPEGKVELDKLVAYLKSHTDVFVEFQSHTDCRGTNQYNVWLAEQRSKSCVNYILNQGISSSQIIAKGFGENQLKNKCSDKIKCSENEHQDNRRTELYIKLSRNDEIDFDMNLKLKN